MCTRVQMANPNPSGQAAELMARDLSQIDLAVLMIDGIVFTECCCVVAVATATSLAPTSLATGFFVGTWDSSRRVDS
jgi:hypothetical protein